MSTERESHTHVHIEDSIIHHLPDNTRTCENAEIEIINRDSTSIDNEERRENLREQNIKDLMEKLQQECGDDYFHVLKNEYDRQKPVVSPNQLQRHSTPRYLPEPIKIISTSRRPSSMQIPVFEGKQPGKPGYVSVEVFLRSVHLETRIGDFTDPERILLARDYIRGAARNKFDNHQLLNATSWNHFESKMLDVFGISQDEMLTHLHLLTPYRKIDEPLCEYIDRISVDLNNYSPSGEMPDHEKVHHLRRILKITLPQELKTPLLIERTYDDLVRGVLAYAEGQTQARLTEADIMRERETGLQPTVSAATMSTRERENVPINASSPSSVAAIGGGSRTEKNTEGKEKEETCEHAACCTRHQLSGNRGTHGSSSRGRNYNSRGRSFASGKNRNNQCAGCGGNHPRSTCVKSQNATCYHCGIRGHLSFVCRKNGYRATDPFPVATSTPVVGAPPAPQHRFRAPPAPQYRFHAPPSGQMPAVAAAPTHVLPQGTFPWVGRPQMPNFREQQQQQQQQQRETM